MFQKSSDFIDIPDICYPKRGVTHLNYALDFLYPFLIRGMYYTLAYRSHIILYFISGKKRHGMFDSACGVPERNLSKI